MATNKSDNHPEVPGLTTMAGFAVFLAVMLLGLVLFLHFKFGVQAPV